MEYKSCWVYKEVGPVIKILKHRFRHEIKKKDYEKGEREVLRSLASYSSVAPAHLASSATVVYMFGIVQNA